MRRGETLGIVGESGSGKSMTCLSILRLVPEPGGRIVGGADHRSTARTCSPRAPRRCGELRGSRIAMILQDPMASLNPALTVGEQIAETLPLHRGLRGRALDERVLELLRQVRISDPERRVHAYPHQMSGGIRQRVAGAIAISCQPSLLIADEPTTSLDVTIQAQYLRLLKDIQRETNLALVFVTHDLGIVAKLCDRVAVMYAGRIVETGPTREIFNRPRHPYTIGLLNCLPTLRRGREPLTAIEGQPPDLATVPPRLQLRRRAARWPSRAASETRPPLEAVAAEHLVACLRAGGDGRPARRGAGRLRVAGRRRRARPRRRPARATSSSKRASAHQALPGRARRDPEPHGGHGEGGRRRRLRPAPRRDARARRRERLRQDAPPRGWSCAWSGPPAGGILFRGRDVHALGAPGAGATYRRAVQAVFQDPYSSLNPRLPIRTTVGEPLRPDAAGPRRAPRSPSASRPRSSAWGYGRASPTTILTSCPAASASAWRSPARSPPNPECILLDEAVSALDVSIRAQVMNLLREIQDRLGVSYLFIAHDLAVVKYVSTRIGVMYLGKLVETAASDELYAHPLHPYTQVLLSNALPAHPDDAREEVDPARRGAERVQPARRAAASTRAVRTPCRVAPRWSRRSRSGRRAIRVACHLYDT